MVENEIYLKLKCLMSDNGGEHEDVNIKKYYAENRITMEKNILKKPQQNSFPKMMNRTLNERARSMRLHTRLPNIFYADVVNTIAYLINRGPSVLD